MAVNTMTKAAMMYLPRSAVIRAGKQQVQDVSAADKLVAGDRGVSEEHCDHAEHAGSLVVARLEQIGNGELREPAGTRRDEVDQQQAGPASAALPERGETMTVGVFCAGQQRTRADPRREQCENQHKGGQRAPRNQVIGFRLHLVKTRQ